MTPGKGALCRHGTRASHWPLANFARARSRVDGKAGERSDVAAFELLTRALIGIALEGLEVAGGQVSLPQFRLLLALGGLGRVPSSKLAAQLRLAPSAITRMVDRLQDTGLVQRGTDPHSKSIVTDKPTAAGYQLIDAVLSHRHELLGAILDQMAPADHAVAVRTARQFTSLSGGAIAVGESGPVPL